METIRAMSPQQVSLKVAALDTEETNINRRCYLMTSEMAEKRIAEIQAERNRLLSGDNK